MTLDKQYLEASLQNLQRQRREALDMVLRCDGAIEACERMTKRLSEPEPAKEE